MKTYIYVIISIICLNNLAFSQTSFIPHNVTYGSYPYEFSLADVDGDSDLDIIVVFYNDYLLAWYPNNGIGAFDSLHVIDDLHISFAGVLDLSDLNEDGNIDILAGSKSSVKWYKNLGSGNFAPSQIINNLSDITSICSSDLDNDSLKDIISASYTNGTISWQKNLGNGSFGSQQIITSNVQSVYSIRSKDLDLDGNMDFVFADYLGNKVVWYKNLGGGIFGTEQILTSNAEGATCIRCAHIDNDSLPDVMTSHAYWMNDKVTWHKNLGNGSFSQEMVINDTIVDPKCFVPTDLDGDNDMDIVITSRLQDSLLWQENLGNGVFGPMQVINDNLLGAYYLCSGDLNGDGAMDIVAGGQESSSLEIYINHGTGLFDLTQTIANATVDVRSIHAADLDNDGQKDILSASRGDNKVAWYKNLGNKQFSLQKVISDQRWDTRSVFPADIDNDGSLDVFSSAWEDTLAWHKNDGNGNFNDLIKLPNTPESSIVIAKDLDNDGLDDLIFTMGGIGNALYMTKNLGNGSYGSLQLLYSLVAINTVGVNDINNDGYQDIVFGSGSTLASSLNDGTGNFPIVQNINLTDGALALQLEDVNGDGFKDIVYTVNDVSWNTIVGWYPNDGLGNFSTPTMISTVDDFCYTIAATDIDNDGDMDVITAPNVTNVASGNLVWFENHGNGSFGTVQDMDFTGGRIFKLHISDLDDDNDQDIIVALNHKDNIKWLENPLNNLMETITICAEDSAQIFGNWVSQPGDYTDTLTNSQGGDSINIVRVENYQTYFPTDTVSICQGETYNFYGQVLDTAGLYHATFQSIHGCDSIEELPLVLIPAPEVSISAFVPDSVSIITVLLPLPTATPPGGTYSGAGTIDNAFNPSIAGLGEHWITYTYTDTITGCTGMDSTLIKVYDPIGIDEIEAPNIKLYPNPGTGDFVLTGTALQSVRISTLDGELVKEVEITNPMEVRFSLKGQAKGTYLVHIINGGVEVKKVLVLM